MTEVDTTGAWLSREDLEARAAEEARLTDSGERGKAAVAS